MIEFKLHQTFSMNVKTPSIRNLYRGNYDGINQFLSGVYWISVFNLTKNINNIYWRFTNIVEESIKSFIPFYKINKTPHFFRYLRVLQHLKISYANKLKQILPSNFCTKIVYKKSISSFYLGKESAILSSPSKRTYFGFINHKLKARSQIPPLLDNTNQLMMEPENKAKLLNKQLKRIFITDDGNTLSLS